MSNGLMQFRLRGLREGNDEENNKFKNTGTLVLCDEHIQIDSEPSLIPFAPRKFQCEVELLSMWDS